MSETEDLIFGLRQRAAELGSFYQADIDFFRACADALAAQPQSSQEAREKEITRLATIEECALVAEEQKQAFLSPEYAFNQPIGSFCERFACDEVAKAIRALAVTRPDREGK